MKTDIRELIKTKRLFFDGGTGTVLQSMGLQPGETPESWNLTNSEKITALHKSYLDAGCNIIKTNTFGINKNKYGNYEEMIVAALGCAKKAVEGYEDVYIAFDIGPTGRLLEPLGDLAFEDAVDLFAANINVAKKNGADIILIETMNDSYETKAAVLAAKENCDLPIFVTNAYDENGKLMTGASPEAMIALLEGLGVDALGMNCSMGPDMMLDIIPKFAENASVPVIVNPNAGLPQVVDGKTVFGTNAETFADYMVKMAEAGACILGGCCGTTPEYIRNTKRKVSVIPYRTPDKKNKTVVSSYTHSVSVDTQPVLIGERINPTGKPKLKQALKENNINYILNEAVRQTDKGVHILDVNVGLPEIDEAKVMYNCIKAIQAVTDVPLQIDSSDPQVLDRAMRIYNGKPLINSVNGKKESMGSIFPLIKKYGGCVIALTIDENGIPDTARGRADIAAKIALEAEKYGIDKKEIIVDPLALSVSSDTNSANITLEAIRLIKEMGLRTSLGVSNISFGLPQRDKINSAFFACALENGLDCAIMNPFSQPMTDTYYAYRVLHGLDNSCIDYITYADNQETAQEKNAITTDLTLHVSIANGMKEQATELVKAELDRRAPLDIINGQIIPALNEIGIAFENKKAYLPQLLMSAEAASAAFEEIKAAMPKNESDGSKSVILATVKGDIHDIGKNIVKVMLESYGFTVYDEGRDIAPEKILEKAKQTGCRLVGLSALMTTTVPAMAETVKLLKENVPDIKVMVGGAVLNEDYAQMIDADFYGKDAMDAVRLVQKYYA
ncbi:MAG: homocysteine S-methyltransferase family protein [Clostridia bacterium]|nr:homocysteine S-methyltransferase family protein [Clostridia bacterium]